MPRKQASDDLEREDDYVGLRLAVPEREILLTCPNVAVNDLRDRVSKASPREIISFTFEELEDLHRGLAFEANKTLDNKRAKKIGKVLQKIEEALDDDEFDDDDDAFARGTLLDEVFAPAGSLPPDISEGMLEAVFNSVAADSARSMPPFSVKLSPAERATLRGMETISLDVHKMAMADSPAGLELQLNMRQMITTMLAIREAVTLAGSEKAAQPYLDIADRLSDGMTKLIQQTESMDDDNTIGIDDAERYRESQQSPAQRAFQLKITLDKSKPAIWRSVVVADCTLDVLHQIVQVAMGWTNSHMHTFEFGRYHFSDPRFEIEADTAEYDETQVLLSELVEDGCKRLRYRYDFGDDWCHTIAIEKKLTPRPTDKYPICLKGTGACPPEDCGGLFGYYALLEALRDPQDERHHEAVDFVGAGFDADHFDLDDTNKALATGCPAYCDD